MRPDQIFSLAIVLLLLGIVSLALSNIEVPVPPEPQAFVDRDTNTDEQKQENAPKATDVYYGVERVVDGDTIIIQGLADSIRLIGIDTPELRDPRGRVECFAKEATQRLEELIGGKEVILEADLGDRDRYHRLLRYVYLPDGTFINLLLIKEGYASLLTIPPNVRYAPMFFAAQQEARVANRGLWNRSACSS